MRVSRGSLTGRGNLAGNDVPISSGEITIERDLSARRKLGQMGWTKKIAGANSCRSRRRAAANNER